MNSNQLPVSGGVAIFIAVIISYFVYSPEDLSGVRPNDSRAIEQVHGDQDVQARLWQDPFAAVAIHKHSKEKDPVQIRAMGKTTVFSLSQTSSTTFELDVKSPKGDATNKSSEAPPHSFKNLTSQIANEFTESKKPVNVLSVMVSAGPYPEDEERRLRRRYAVIAGLAASGYQPENAAHIGYVDDLPKAKTKDEASCKGNHRDDVLLPAIMPYEWFKNSEDDSYFLLLWLDEDAFARKPLCKLSFLVGEMTKGEIEGAIDEFKIIGPSSSGTLKSMTKELEKGGFDNLKNNVQIFSAIATAQDSVLTGNDNWKKSPDGLDSVEEAFKAHGISLFRTIADDGALAKVLTIELTNRIFDLTEKSKQENFQIALVSEWDTLYGRSLPDAFVEQALEQQLKSAEDRGGKKFLGNGLKSWMHDQKIWQNALMPWQKAQKEWGKADQKQNEAQTAWNKAQEDWKAAKEEWKQKSKLWRDEKRNWEQTHIYRFSYLRGIDGRITGESRKEKSSEKGSKQGSEKNAVIDRPEGRSQRDYLRRLAGDMQLKDQQLKNEGTKGIRAIGILGSDVYDKLMVLRVLRQRFPKAIFFTTDLDASLLHPREFQWTRNMLVASSYDLKIADQVGLLSIIRTGKRDEALKVTASAILMRATKDTIPRFRDAYQTSIYLSTQWATNKELSDNNTKNKKLFERSYQVAKAKEEVEKLKKAFKDPAVKVAKAAAAKAQQAESVEQAERDAAVKVAKAAAAKAQQAEDAEQAERDAQEAVQKANDAFRDVFGTTKPGAVAQQEKRWLLFKGLFKGNLHPRVYEIGRNGAVELMGEDKQNKLNISPFYPTKPAVISTHSVFIVAACLMVFALLAFAFWCRWIVTSDEGDMDDGLYKNELNGARWMTGAILVVLCFLQFLWMPSFKIMGWLAFIGYILFAAIYCVWLKNIMAKK